MAGSRRMRPMGEAFFLEKLSQRKKPELAKNFVETSSFASTSFATFAASKNNWQNLFFYELYIFVTFFVERNELA